MEKASFYPDKVYIKKQQGAGNETDLHQNKKNSRPADPTRKLQGRVTGNKQFFKSSLIQKSFCLKIIFLLCVFS